MKPSAMLLAARLLALASVFSCAEAATSRMQMESSANPIRRVVNMLSMMQTKVQQDAKLEEELFEKFMCYCKTGVKELADSISNAERKLPQLKSALEEATALKQQLGAEIKAHKADKAEAQDAVEEAKQLRTKEAAAFAKEEADSKSNIAATGKAIVAIKKGMKGSFLQTRAAKKLQKLVIDTDMLKDIDRDMLSAFLSEDHEDYSPAGGQIVGILNQMKDTMVADLEEITKTEQQAQASFKELMATQKKEIDTNQKALESKLERDGEVGVEVETLKGDLEDTAKGLEEDKKFIAELKKGCSSKQGEFDEAMKMRNQELLAIADTIKILNDDDALELFKKTLPAPSFLQIQMTSKDKKAMALKALGKSRKMDPRIQMIAIQLKGHSKGFEKVLKMVDVMVGLLGKEQATDDSKKEYCEAELDKTEDELKVLTETLKDLTAAIKDAESTINGGGKALEEKTAQVQDLDKQVDEATSQRKQENAEYEELVASNTAAKDLLKMAKNRLAKFYAPKLYKPPAKKELSAAGRIEENFAGAANFVQVQMHMAMKRRADDADSDSDDSAGAPPPPPETAGPYKKKTEEGNGVMSMMDLLIADIDKELTEAKVEEDHSQAQYEAFVDESAKKRASLFKSIEQTKGNKADMEGKLEKMTLEKKATTKETFSKTEVLGDLHGECDWLLQNYDSRKAARTGEIESLKNAKAVLSGADFSLAQAKSQHRASLRGTGK